MSNCIVVVVSVRGKIIDTMGGVVITDDTLVNTKFTEFEHWIVHV